MIGKTITEVARGDHAEIVRTVQDQDIADFIEAVGDVNPLHSDVAYTATTPFKEPIAPGLFTAGLISSGSAGPACRGSPGSFSPALGS